MDDTIVLQPETLPPDAKLEGCHDFCVQDLIVKSHTMLYRRAVYRLPDEKYRWCEEAVQSLEWFGAGKTLQLNTEATQIPLLGSLMRAAAGERTRRLPRQRSGPMEFVGVWGGRSIGWDHCAGIFRFDVDGVVDDPICELGTLELGAAFKVDAAKATGTVMAKNRVGKRFASNEFVVVTAKVNARTRLCWWLRVAECGPGDPGRRLLDSQVHRVSRSLSPTRFP